MTQASVSPRFKPPIQALEQRITITIQEIEQIRAVAEKKRLIKGWRKADAGGRCNRRREIRAR